MATLRRSLSAMVLASLMLLVPVSTAAAQCPTCVVPDTIRYVEDRDEEDIIPAAWPTHDDARECIFKGSCPHLEDIAYVDVDISDQMESATDGARFSVNNELVGPITMWLVCSYDGSGQALDCWFDDERGWGADGDLSNEARELRLFPVQSGPAEYDVRITVY